ncbi:hypothetical protein [Stutzerimonas stutzeri]|uniref:Uncharacterized protein n=1 Tax=Stutzerimonas stutzeri KOS6 TaxID=1218352 RepID=A0A061JJS3_STUST|nr:hypothetical protein [Stutzerimonas stutzeri]EWC39572.1 hypothetical protein B597_019470 [Stutzerimonas stutzeri KOS6]
MAKAPKPMPVYLTLRKMIDPATGKERAAFVAASEADASLMAERGFKLNAKVRADIKQPRNERFNRLVHGLGRVLAQNIDRFAGMQAHAAIKELQAESGVYCDREEFDIPGLGRLSRQVPQSLAFDSMGEEAFQDFWRQCCAYLVKTDWPTLTEERLTEMAEFETFREVA